MIVTTSLHRLLRTGRATAATPRRSTDGDHGSQRNLPATRPSGPAWPPGSPSIGAGRHSAGRASRTSPYSLRWTWPPHPQSRHCTSRQVRRSCRLPLLRARRSPRTTINPALIPLPPTTVPLPAAPAPLRCHRPPHLRISLEATEPGRRRSACLQSTETRSGRNLRHTHTRSRLSLRPMREDRPIV